MNDNDNTVSPEGGFITTPVQDSSLNELTDLVKKQAEEQNKFFKNITPPDTFARLETDVKHLWNYFKGLASLALAIILAAIGAYYHIENKISDIDKDVDLVTKETDIKYKDLEGRVIGNINNINTRIDRIIIANGSSINSNNTIPTAPIKPTDLPTKN